MFEIIFPLHRQELFFHIVARFTARNHVSPGAFAAAGNRNDVIHGQLFGRRRAPAVITFTLCHLAFPPLGFPEFPGLAAFPFQIRFFQIIGKGLNWLSFFHGYLTPATSGRSRHRGRRDFLYFKQKRSQGLIFG